MNLLEDVRKSIGADREEKLDICKEQRRVLSERSRELHLGESATAYEDYLSQQRIVQIHVKELAALDLLLIHLDVFDATDPHWEVRAQQLLEFQEAGLHTVDIHKIGAELSENYPLSDGLNAQEILEIARAQFAVSLAQMAY